MAEVNDWIPAQQTPQVQPQTGPDDWISAQPQTQTKDQSGGVDDWMAPEPPSLGERVVGGLKTASKTAGDVSAEVGTAIGRSLGETAVVSPLQAIGTEQATYDTQLKLANEAPQFQQRMRDLLAQGTPFYDAYRTVNGEIEQRRRELATVSPADTGAYQTGQAVSDWLQKGPLASRHILNPVVEDLISAGASTAANIGASLVPGIGPELTLFNVMSQGTSQAARDAVESKKATPAQQQEAGQLGTPVGLTEFADALLPHLGAPGKVAAFLGKLGPVVTRVLEGVFLEGGQEGLSQVLNNLIEKGIYNPEKNVWQDVPYNTFIGAVTGAGFAGVLGGHSQDSSTQTQPQPGGAPQDGLGNSLGSRPLPDAAQLGEAFSALRGTPLEAPAADAIVARMLPQQAPLTATPGGVPGTGQGLGQAEGGVQAPREAVLDAPQPEANRNVGQTPEQKAAYDAGFARQELPVGVPLELQEAWRLGAQDRTTADLKNAPPPPDKLRGFVDTRGQGRRFMGAGTEVTLQSEGHKGSPISIYGDNVTYSTDGIDIAHGYANRKGAIQPTIYEVIEKRPTRLFDMEAPITPEVRSQVESLAQNSQAANLVNAGLGHNPKSLREFYDDVRDFAAKEQIPAKDVQELVFNPLNDAISSLGYDGMTHIGGQRTRYPEHKVTIYFPQRDAIELRRMDAKELEDLRKKPDGTPTQEQFFRITQPYRRLLAAPDMGSFIRIANELGIEHNSPQFTTVLGEWTQTRRASGANEATPVTEPIATFAEAPRVSYSLGEGISEEDYRPNIVYVPNKTARESLEGISFDLEGRAVFTQIPRFVQPSDANETGANVLVLHSAPLKAWLDDIQLPEGATDVQRMVFEFIRGRLLETVPDTQVHMARPVEIAQLTPWTPQAPLGVSVTPNVQSLNVAEPSQIFLNSDILYDPTATAHTLVHEAIHTATSRLLANSWAFRRDVQFIMDEVSKQIQNSPQIMEVLATRPDPHIGFTPLTHIFLNEREFIAEVFGNPEFQHILSNMQMPVELVNRLKLRNRPTFWQGVVQLIRRYWGLESNLETYSALEAAMRIGDRVIDAQARLPGSPMRPSDAPYIIGREANLRAVQEDGGSKDLPAVGHQPEIVGTREALIRVIEKGAPGKVNTQIKMNINTYAGHADRITWLHKLTAGLDQIVTASPNFAPLVGYKETVVAAHRDETTLQDAVVTLGKEWLRLGPEGDRLSLAIDEIANMEYRSQSEKTNQVVRQPTPQELDTIFAKHNVSQRGRNLYDKAVRFIDGMNQIHLQAMIARVNATVQDPLQRARRIAKLTQAATDLKKRPYFPMGNFGRHHIIVNDPSGKIVGFYRFEREGYRSAERVQNAAAKQIAKDWQAQYGQAPRMGVDIKIGVLPDTVSPLIGLPPALLEGIVDIMQLNEEQINAANWLILAHTLDSAPILKTSAQRRHYVPGYGADVDGYSFDMRRAFAQYGFHSARYYSRLKYHGTMRAFIEEAEKAGVSDRRAGEIARFMKEHFQKGILDARGDFGHFRGAIFIWAMGYVPMTALQNITQLPIVVASHLMGNFGTFKAGRQLIAQAFNVKNLYKRGNYDQHNPNQAFFERAISYGIKTGRITETQAPELVGMAQNNILAGVAGNKAQRAWMRFLSGASYVFEHAEQYNRRVTFRAALELGLQNPNAKYVSEAIKEHPQEFRELQAVWGDAQAKAIIAAVHATEKTNYIYAKWARPKLFRGPIGATLFVFKNFPRATVWTLAQNPKMIIHYTLIMAAMAGLEGLPFADTLFGLIKVIGKWAFGKDWDVNRLVRKHVIELTNGTVPPDLVLHGLSRYGFGVPMLVDLLGSFATGKPGRGLAIPTDGIDPKTGLPIRQGYGQNVPAPVFDFSQMISMGNVIPLDVGMLAGGGDVDTMIAKQGQQLSGAVFSVGFNILRALADQHLEWGDPKRWERAVPRGLANASKAFRKFYEGRERTMGGPGGGTTVVSYDARDPEHMAELFGTLLGARPAREAARWDVTVAKKEVETFTKTMRQGLIESFYEANQTGRQEEIDSVKDAIKRFNQELPDSQKGMTITPDTIRGSVKARVRGRTLRERGLPATKGAIGGAREVESLFPESTIDVRRR